MPGNVVSASPTVVMPKFLCSQFVEVRTYTRIMNEFPDGSNVRRTIETTSRKRWQLSPRIGVNEWNAIRSFLVPLKGSPFYYYNLTETSPLYTVDSSGASTAGRYSVRLNGDLQYATRLSSRWDASFELIEVA